jgi:hypothetical protein
METENLQYKIVMNPDAEVLGRLAHLELASAAYQAAVVSIPFAISSSIRARRSSRAMMGSRGRSHREIPI